MFQFHPISFRSLATDHHQIGCAVVREYVVGLAPPQGCMIQPVVFEVPGRFWSSVLIAFPPSRLQWASAFAHPEPPRKYWPFSSGRRPRWPRPTKGRSISYGFLSRKVGDRGKYRGAVGAGLGRAYEPAGRRGGDYRNRARWDENTPSAQTTPPCASAFHCIPRRRVCPQATTVEPPAQLHGIVNILFPKLVCLGQNDPNIIFCRAQGHFSFF